MDAVSGGDGISGLPAELVDAFARRDGAWEQWSQQDDGLLTCYVRWVAAPRVRLRRRRRARRTADYASRGVLRESVQPPRPRGILAEIRAAVLIWLTVSLLVAGCELIANRVLHGHFAWPHLRFIALLSAMSAGSSARTLWRHSRAPTAAR